MNQVILLCGSNIGDRENQLLLSQKLLEEQEKIKILKTSSIYETAPWGDLDQGAFLNQALLIETTIEPEPLLALVKTIELKAGRVNTRKWGPRALDIDILFYNQLILENEALQIPHKEVQNRAFALIPAAEIAGDWKDPRNGNSIAELYTQCEDKLPVIKISTGAGAL